MRQLLAGDVDLNGGWIPIVSREEHRTKTGESRDIPIHRELVPFLRRGNSSSGPWYFTAEASNRYPPGGHWINTKKLNDRLQVVLRRIGHPTGRDDGFVIHSLRHFFETHCVNARVPQRVVDIWMGHQGDRSTARYYDDLKPTESVNFMQGINFSQPTTLLAK